MKIFRGFTLAEVLVTLGVIGVVSALTLPTLIQNYQKQATVSKLKKAYTVLNQALKLSEADNGEYIYWDDINNGTKYFEKYWKPYLKVIKLCQTYSDCGYESGTPFKLANGNSIGTGVVVPLSRATFILNDGCLVLMFIYSGSGSGTAKNNSLYVDINSGNGPNTFGKDVFLFTRNEKGVLYPLGYNLSEDDVYLDCKTNGYYCAAKIINDGWKISDDYPW